jgi:hypothetical protein
VTFETVQERPGQADLQSFRYLVLNADRYISVDELFISHQAVAHFVGHRVAAIDSVPEVTDFLRVNCLLDFSLLQHNYFRGQFLEIVAKLLNPILEPICLPSVLEDSRVKKTALRLHPDLLIRHPFELVQEAIISALNHGLHGFSILDEL